MSNTKWDVRCDYCGKFIGETNPGTVIQEFTADYWNGPDEKLMCRKCVDEFKEN